MQAGRADAEGTRIWSARGFACWLTRVFQDFEHLYMEKVPVHAARNGLFPVVAAPVENARIKPIFLTYYSHLV
jgi:hypothetical protein